MVRLKHPLRTLLILIAAAVFVYAAWTNWGPRHAPAGQPGLGQLNAATLRGFKASFNAHPYDPRLLLLLSPT